MGIVADEQPMLEPSTQSILYKCYTVWASSSCSRGGLAKGGGGEAHGEARSAIAVPPARSIRVRLSRKQCEASVVVAGEGVASPTGFLEPPWGSVWGLGGENPPRSSTCRTANKVSAVIRLLGEFD